MTQRIQKFLSQQGLASRRTIENWIKLKRLKVNGDFASLGMKIDGTEKFTLDNQMINIKPMFSPISNITGSNNFQNKDQNMVKLLLYHKPVGLICSTKDPFNHRPTVFEDLPKISYGKWISIGRLDINTSGLLLFTNNGDLAHKFMHPNFNKEREYLVRVYGPKITEKQLSLFTKGILLVDGLAKFTKISLLNSAINNQNDNNSHFIAKSKSCNNWYKVALTEGRNREVKKLFATQNLIVNRLIRIRFGNIILPKNLKPREYQFINVNYLI